MKVDNSRAREVRTPAAPSQRPSANVQKKAPAPRKGGIGKRQEEAQADSNKHVVIMEHVTKTYPAQPQAPALYDVSLTIDQGEFVFLVGHSGSGKSTFISSLIREIVPDSGRLEVGGYNLLTMRESRVPYLRRNIGCVFQDFKLLPNKTAYENVAFAMECIGASQKKVHQHVPEVLKLVGLKDKQDKYPDELSGGEQQRVSIARAIINQPPLLICDEPTGNLDPGISAGIMELLLAINSTTQTTVLVATHDQEMVNNMHKRVIRLHKGHLVSDEEDGAY